MFYKFYSFLKNSKFYRKFVYLIPSNIKSKLSNLICNPAIGGLLEKVYRNRIPGHGLIIDTNNTCISKTSKAKVFWGIYESAEVAFVNNYLQPGFDVIELGGSIGLVSSIIRKKLSDAERLVIVEANPYLIESIKSNLTINAPDKNYQICPKAISSFDGFISFQVKSENTSGRIQLAQKTKNCLDIPTISLSKLLLEYKYDNSFVLVSDIEGAEAEIIYKDIDSLKRCQLILIELHETEIDNKHVSVQNMIDIIQENGFILKDRYGNVCLLEKKHYD